MDDWNISADYPEEGDRPCGYTVTSKKDPTISFKLLCSDLFGVPHPIWLTMERWKRLDRNVRYKESDIIVSTYPKCGTTWVEQIVLSLLTKADDQILNPVHKNSYVPGETSYGKIWIESTVEQDPKVEERMGLEGRRMNWDDFDNAPSPRVIKTHAPSHLLLGTDHQGVKKLPKGLKCIVVTRNPLDACVSSYYHAFNPFKSGWPFSAWASVWLSGNVQFGSWFDWVKGWRSEYESHPDQICWIHYEQVASDPHSEIRKVAAFLNLEFDDDLIERVVQSSRFDSMKQQASEKGGDRGGHLRKGIVGDWENHFTPELLIAFKDRYRSEFGDKPLDYSFGSRNPFEE